MKITEFRGQFHKITDGRIMDFRESIDLAVGTNPHFDVSLRAYVDRSNVQASQADQITKNFGTSDKHIICIAGMDVPSIGPLAYNSPGSKKFFDPNRLGLRTYFDRLTLIKKIISDNDLPWEKVTLFPSFPKHHYPYFHAHTQQEDDVLFRYMCVESKHHYDRVRRTPPNIPVAFRNYTKRKTDWSSRNRTTLVDHYIRERNQDSYLLYVPYETDGPQGVRYVFPNIDSPSFIESRAEKVLQQAHEKDMHAVFGIPLVYDHHECTQENWFEAHCRFEDHLRKIGADMAKTHVTYRLQEAYSDRFDEERKAFSYPQNAEICEIR